MSSGPLTRLDRLRSSIGAPIRLGRDYFLFWVAQTLSTMGDGVGSLVLSVLVLKETGSAEMASIAVVLRILPPLFVGPLAGLVLRPRQQTNRHGGHRSCQSDPHVYVGYALYAGAFGVRHAFFGCSLQEPCRLSTNRDHGLDSVTGSGRIHTASQRRDKHGEEHGHDNRPALGGFVLESLGGHGVMWVNAFFCAVSALCVHSIRQRGDIPLAKAERPGLRGSGKAWHSTARRPWPYTSCSLQ